MTQKKVSKALLHRLPRYLEYLKKPEMEHTYHISATALANALDMGEVLVRKDLALVSDGGGRPWVGYCRESLIADIEHFLGCDVPTRTVLVGVGRLGMALLNNHDLELYGVKIVAAFDANPCVAQTESGVPTYHMEDLEEFCRNHRVSMGIITVPGTHAQEVCDRLVAANIKAVWNFTSVYLHTPDRIFVQNDNIKTSLTELRLRLQEM